MILTKRILISLILLTVAVFAAAQGNYYDAVLNLTGQELFNALQGLISTNTYSNYIGARTFLFQQLENHNGYVTCIYTGYEFNVGYNYTGSNNPNTEHTYCQSWFSSPQSSVKKADLHHLFPSNSTVNSVRSNYPIYNIGNHANANVYYDYTPWQSYRGMSPGGYTVFEPADESKGDIARALLYFHTRYNDGLIQQNVDMLPVLVQWHFFDPPTPEEVIRNNGVQGFQSNRNPFVDHPEFVARIWDPSAAESDVPAPEADLVLGKASPNPFTDSTSVEIQSKIPVLATISIHNIKGQKLDSWQENLPRGNSQITWNGRNAQGEKAAPGIYLINLSAPGHFLTARVMLQ